MALEKRILTINTGSSSLKAALYRVGETERRELAASFDRIGGDGSRMHVVDARGATILDEPRDLPDHQAALHLLFSWLEQSRSDAHPEAVGHRVVHGGSRYAEPAPITPELIAALEQLARIDPEHLPNAIDAIRFVASAYPAIPQVACFDTAFHRRMPAVAQRYALPRRYFDAGVVRYGFHGLSYEYIMSRMRAIDAAAARGRIVVAHLGNGASMAAIRDGTSVDTTMGFTPTGGLVMGTRSGDLDPGVLLYMLQTEGLRADIMNRLLNQESGLLGVSGSSGDVRDLLAKEASDHRAAEAIELFCYQARKFVGALAAVLGGLDTLIFTGGIGEHAGLVRQRICAGLEFIGVRLDPTSNEANASIISPDGALVTVRVIPTDEDLMIARHTYRLLNQTKEGENNVSI